MSDAVIAAVGANGGGKTLFAVQRVAMRAWAAGRPVVSNLHLHPEAVGYDPALYVPLESWRQIVELRECALILDEISSVLPSRQAMSVPPQLVRILNQLRKGDVYPVAWTAPNWARCDVLLREVTQQVTVCRGFFPDRHERDESRRYRFPRTGPRRGPYTRGWGPNRLFRFMTYDAVEFDEFTYSLAAQVKPKALSWYWRPAADAHRAYDTLETVEMLDHLDDIGVCVGCGGNRSRPQCSCEEYQAARRGGKPREGAPAQPGGRDGQGPRVVHDHRQPGSPINGRSARSTAAATVSR